MVTLVQKMKFELLLNTLAQFKVEILHKYLQNELRELNLISEIQNTPMEFGN